MDIKLDSYIDVIPGIGERKKLIYNRLNIFTIRDILNHYPLRYEDRRMFKRLSEIRQEEMVSIKGIIQSFEIKKPKKGMTLIKVTIRDGYDIGELTFFNNKYISNKLITGRTIKAYGKAKREFGKVRMTSPDFEFDSSRLKTGCIYPVYPLTRGLSNDEILKVLKLIINQINMESLEYLDRELREKLKLCGLGDAIKNIHFPKDPILIKIAKYRLVFDEFFILHLGLKVVKGITEIEKGISFKNQSKLLDFIKNLPFKLTDAQEKVVKEILSDMQRPVPMQRLVQGDVGSGKTIVAFISLYNSYLNGYQGAMMAPTEILAKQHYESAKEIFCELGLTIHLLTGSTTKKQKELIYKSIRDGECDILIGTHALIEDKVDFKNLGIVITDEQHRFGVRQRGKLLGKSDFTPDMIVMTATPIPRTLALIVHGDLDISIIDQMPSGRKPIKTYAVEKKKRNDVYSFAAKEIDKGRQIYVVCPLIEENEKMDLKSAQDLYESLKSNYLKDYKIGLLHGKMKAKEKQEIMDSFLEGSIDVLVSTTVIEVGINVPNASVMIIEDSQRFGLSQLHQLRGRVGRGEYQSYCVLVYVGKNEVTKERIKTMVSTNDGFEISQKDLILRGQGELFGTRQHGIPEFKLADISKHQSVLKLAQQIGDEIIENDPKLERKENYRMKTELRLRMTQINGIIIN